MARSYFQIAIHHEGLGKQRVIRGTDRYLVEVAARSQRQAWDEQHAKKLGATERRREREDRKAELADNLCEAEKQTREARAAIDELRGILAATLRGDDRIHWDHLKQHQLFSQPAPQARPYLPLPPEPQAEDPRYRPQRSLMDKLLISTAEKKERAARELYKADHTAWQVRTAAVQSTNEGIYKASLREFEDWQRRAAAYEAARQKHNAAIDQQRDDYRALMPEAILDYCDLVLSQSKYPACFPQECDLDYRAASKTILVEYRLPAPGDLPRLAEVKFVRSKGAFSETELAKKHFDLLYDDTVCQLALRTIHELFETDVVRAIETVIFNGTVRTIHSGTGHPESRCILSVQASRDAFLDIDLRNVQARACIESLGGIAAAKLADLKLVRPIATLDFNDARFANAEDLGADSGSALDEWHELAKTLGDPQDIRFLPVGAVAALLGFPVEEKFSIALSKELAEAVAARGCGIEPDARYGGASYRAVDEIALFRPLETAVTGAYPGAAALLQLCITIGAADGQITDDELKVTRDFFQRNASLTSQEQQRLLVLEQHLCRNPDMATRSLSRLAKRLPTAQRQLVCEVLVCVAGADGVITSTEWAALDRACQVLELPTSALDEILRKLGASFDEPTMQEAEPATPGEPLPGVATAVAAPSFKLDMSRVAAISHETAEVIGLLSAVMSEDEPTRISQPVAAPAPQPQVADAPQWLGTLDVKYQAIATRIVVKPAWTRTDFQQLAAEFKLMPLGVFDALNEWADEELGDFLLDGDDPVNVNASILPKQS